MDLSKVFLTVAEVSEAIGMKPATASQWILDGFLGGPGDKLAEVAGATTYLSIQTAAALAIANRLRKMGASREVACKAGKEFTELKVPKYEGKGTSKPFTSWLIVFPDGEIVVASFEEKPTKRELQEDCWRIRWEPIVQKVMAAYAFRLPRGQL